MSYCQNLVEYLVNIVIWRLGFEHHNSSLKIFNLGKSYGKRLEVFEFILKDWVNLVKLFRLKERKLDVDVWHPPFIGSIVFLSDGLYLFDLVWSNDDSCVEDLLRWLRLHQIIKE